MKKRIKYLILSLFMIAMLALSACGKKADSESSIPEEVSNQLPVQAESLLNQLYKMDDAELDQVIEGVEQNGQTAFAEGVKNFKSTKELVGDLVGIDDTKVSASEGNYVVKVNYSGEKRKSLNTVLGMGTVFIILIFISFLISLFKYINVFENKLKAKTKEEPVIEAVKVNEPENLEDDLELVAVITAAIAEFSNTDASNLIVRSIKRVKR